MKRLLSLVMAIMLVVTMTACTKKEADPANADQGKPEVTGEENGKESKDEIAKKACLITTTPLGNDFTDLIWSGFQELEKKAGKLKQLKYQKHQSIRNKLEQWQLKDIQLCLLCLMN